MGPIDRPKIRELIQQAESLGYGPAKVAILEEAVRLADLLADIELGFQTRAELVEAANFSGLPERSLVAFSWCLAMLDRQPGRFPLWDTLWQYKWIVNDLAGFPQIPRGQIMEALADFAQRVDRAGYGKRAIYKLQERVAWDLGDVAGYHEAFALWKSAPRDHFSDCRACELDDEVSHLIRTDRDEEALIRARPILDGTMRCKSVPHVTLAQVLLPLVRLGRLAEAVPLHLRGYRLINRNREYLFSVAEHLTFLILTDNQAKGAKLFETHLIWALENSDLLHRLDFSKAAHWLFERIGALGKTTIRLRLPESFELYQESGLYDVTGLTTWLGSDATNLARRFDDRNGNDHYSSGVKAAGELERFIAPFPIKKPGRGGATKPP